MIEEIYQNGPIVCSCSTPQGLYDYKGGIFVDETGANTFDHECEIVGFGVQDTVKYWHVKNTWGSHYGEKGFFKVIRGINNIAIETNCSWAQPIDNWSEGKEYMVHRLPVIDKSLELDHPRKPYLAEKNVDPPCRGPKSVFSTGEVVTSPLPHTLFDVSELPKNFDWRSVFDFNYVSASTNQNVPQHCNS